MNKKEIIEIKKIPENSEDIEEMLRECSSSPYKMAALSVATFCAYEKDKDEAIKMINMIKGPSNLSNLDIQFISDRLDGKGYVVRSYFEGTSKENDYVLGNPPYKIEVSENSYSFNNEGYAKLYLKSSGADTERPITLRKKESTGEWFLWEHTFLSDIRLPKSMDKWA